MNENQKRPVFSGTRLKNQLLSAVTNPFNMVVFVALLLLFCLIVIPLLQMISATFTVGTKSDAKMAGAAVGEFTLYYWKYILVSYLARAALWEPLRNSLIVGFLTTLVSVPVGALLGWLIVRTDIPCKKLLGMLVVIPYMIPSWCKALCWLAVFRNETSGSLGLLSGLGFTIPDWLAYGPVAIVLCMSLHYYAFSYIHVSSALRSINSELEEMGEICGAGKAHILKSVTIPLVMPSLLSAIVMTLSKSKGTYGVAATLGNRIGWFTRATKMKTFINAGPQGVGYAMSLVLIGLAALIIFANQKIIGVRKSYATIGGKGGRSRPMRLGRARIPLAAFIAAFLMIAMVMPLFVLVMETFQINTGSGYGLDNLTLYNWIGTLDQAQVYINYPGIFLNSEFSKAFYNTIRLTVITSAITALCGQLLGYISTRGRGKWYGALTEQLVFIPYLMSGVAFSAIYVSMFSRARFWGLLPALYGTFTLIVLTSVVKHLPFASRSGTANMMQISYELEEAAQVNGAGFWERMWRIVLPLAKNGFVSGFMLTFISVAKELDLIAIMMDKKTMTLSYLAFVYSQDGMNQMADAISVCVLVFILVCYIVANKFGADISKAW